MVEVGDGLTLNLSVSSAAAGNGKRPRSDAALPTDERARSAPARERPKKARSWFERRRALQRRHTNRTGQGRAYSGGGTSAAAAKHARSASAAAAAMLEAGIEPQGGGGTAADGGARRPRISEAFPSAPPPAKPVVQTGARSYDSHSLTASAVKGAELLLERQSAENIPVWKQIQMEAMGIAAPPAPKAAPAAPTVTRTPVSSEPTPDGRAAVISLPPEDSPAAAADESTEDAGDSRDSRVDDVSREAESAAGRVSDDPSGGAEREQTRSEAPPPPRSKVEEQDTDLSASLFDEITFDEVGLSPTLVNHLQVRMAYGHPTRVQSGAIRALLRAHGGAAPPEIANEAPRDALVRSETGSGKTLAFLLPIAHSLLERQRRTARDDGTLAVIVEPTRELALQVEMVAEKLLRPWHWIVVGSATGGEKKKSEKARLRRGVTLLVTTPGRLVDHMRNTQSLSVSHCEWLVLDEADRLLDLGFEPLIRECFHTLNQRREEVAKTARTADREYKARRQNVLVSATITDKVLQLANFTLTDPERVILGGDEQLFKAPERLQQHYCVVDQRVRLITLAAMLYLRAKSDARLKAVVFFSSCDSVDFHHALFNGVSMPEELRSGGGGASLDTPSRRRPRPRVVSFADGGGIESAADLSDAEEQSSLDDGQEEEEAEDYDEDELAAVEPLCGLPALKIHGSMAQSDRQETFRRFMKAKSGILLSTDVSARGLDLQNLSLSVQYDPPTQDEDVEYLHRVGRTARIGGRGDALLFLRPEERHFLGELQRRGMQLREVSADAVLAALKTHAVSRSPRGTAGRSVTDLARQTTSVLQQLVQGAVEENKELKLQASKAYRSYLRAYATHSRAMRAFFDLRDVHLGHVSRSFGIAGEPLSVAQIRRAAHAGIDYGSGVPPDGRTNARRDRASVGEGVRAERSAGSRRTRNTAMRIPSAMHVLSAEFGA